MKQSISSEITSQVLEQQRRQRKNIELVDKYGILLVLILLIVFFALLTGGTLLSFRNVLNVITNIMPIGLIAMGVTIVIITTGIDLSSGSIVACSTVFTALFAQNAAAQNKFLNIATLPFIVPLIIGILIGVVAGFVNGILITMTGIPPFIATLGMMTVARGLALLPTKGNAVGDIDPAIVFLGQGSFIGIPVPIWVFVVMIVISHYLLAHTRFGRYAFAIGGNLQAAKTSGINTKKQLILIYTYAGLLSGIAGIMVTGIVASGQPTSGLLYELDAIAASVIGGTSLYGGIGSILNTIVGVFIIGVLKNGLDLMYVSAYWQQIIRGIIIVLAVVLDVQKRRFKEK